MNTLIVNASDFSRDLSDFLNRVQFNGQVLDIERGKRVVARVSPAVEPGHADGFPLAELDAFLARGPQLPQSERTRVAEDLKAVRSRLTTRADPWAS